MLDLTIDRLSLRIANAGGHEHRVRRITDRAMDLLADGVSERWVVRDRLAGAGNVGGLEVPPVSVDLNIQTDEQAAGKLADAILEALVLKLEV